MSCVLDTCALLAWTVNGRALPKAARPPYLLSAVTWCEIAWKHRHGRLPLPDGYRGWSAVVDQLGLTTVAVDRTQFETAVELDWAHRDPADRLIVALAQQRKLAVVTCDAAITAHYPRCVW